MAVKDSFQALLALLAPNLDRSQVSKDPTIDDGTDGAPSFLSQVPDPEPGTTEEESEAVLVRQEVPLAIFVPDARPWILHETVTPETVTPFPNTQKSIWNGGPEKDTAGRAGSVMGCGPEHVIVPDDSSSGSTPALELESGQAERAPDEMFSGNQSPATSQDPLPAQTQVMPPPLPNAGVAPREWAPEQPADGSEVTQESENAKVGTPAKAVEKHASPSGIQKGDAGRNTAPAESRQPLAFAIQMSPDRQRSPTTTAANPMALPPADGPLPMPREAGPRMLGEGPRSPDLPEVQEPAQPEVPLRAGGFEQQVTERAPEGQIGEAAIENATRDPKLPSKGINEKGVTAIPGTQSSDEQHQEGRGGGRSRVSEEEQRGNPRDARHATGTPGAAVNPGGLVTQAEPASFPDRTPEPAVESPVDVLAAGETDRNEVTPEARNFRIPLAPLGAGPVEIRLAHSAAGVQVRVHAAEAQTRQALQNGLSELIGSLETQGFETHQVTLPADAAVSLPAETLEAARGTKQPADPAPLERPSSTEFRAVTQPNSDQTSYESHPDKQNQPWREANKKRKGQAKASSVRTKEVSWLLSRV